MIKLADTLPLFPSSVTLMHIYCLKKAFDNSVLAADVWTQEIDGKITTVIARYSGRLYIHSENCDVEELKTFINTIGYNEIFCSKSVAEALSLEIINSFWVLCKKDCKQINIFREIPSTSELYNKLLLGKDGDISLPDLEAFVPDISHRLRHAGAVAITDYYGAALAFCCDFGGIINGIAVDKNKRGCRVGSKLLAQLVSMIGGDLFVCCNDKNKDFYIKNGFNQTDKTAFVIAR